MIQVKNAVLIDKPVKEVFALVGNPVRDPEWHFDVVEATEEEPVESPVRGSEETNPGGQGLNGQSRIKPGATFRWVFDYMGQGRQEAAVEVKAYEQERRVELLAVAGGLVQNIGLVLEPMGPSSTLVTRTLALSHSGLPAHMEDVMKPRIENRSTQYLEKLRQLLEDGRAENSSPSGCSCCEG